MFFSLSEADAGLASALARTLRFYGDEEGPVGGFAAFSR